MFRLPAVIFILATSVWAHFSPEVRLILYINEHDGNIEYKAFNDAKHLILSYSFSDSIPFHINPDDDWHYLISDKTFRKDWNFVDYNEGKPWLISPSDDSILVYFKSLLESTQEYPTLFSYAKSMCVSHDSPPPQIERRVVLDYDFVFYMELPLNLYDYVFPITESLEPDEENSVFYANMKRTRNKLAVYFDSNAGELVQVNTFSTRNGSQYAFGLESAFLSKPVMYPACPARFNRWRDSQGTERCLINYAAQLEIEQMAQATKAKFLKHVDKNDTTHLAWPCSWK